jgi:multiple sugar transport system permease protein
MKETITQTTLSVSPIPERQAVEERTHRRKLALDFLRTLLSHLVIFTAGLFFLVPFFWMVITSFKTDQDVFRYPPTWLPYDNVRVQVNGKLLPLYDVKQQNGTTLPLALESSAEGKGVFVDPNNPSLEYKEVRMKTATPRLHISFRWQNYPDAMNRSTRVGMGVTFWTYFRNSLVVAFFSIIGTLLANTPVAYAFSRIRFPGRDWLFIVVLATMMLPFQVTMIPLYLFFNDFLHWGDSFYPLIVPTFFANAYDVFLLRQFFRTIPEELSDAARVDGATEFDIFRQIILPLSTPVLATVTVFTFLWAWNDFQGPLLFLTSPRNYTMALGLQDFESQRTVAWNLLMSASVVFTLPIIIAFFFAQRTFIQGIKLTGLKE